MSDAFKLCCTYCRQPLRGNAVGCPECGLLAHGSCRQGVPACATLGCEAPAVPHPHRIQIKRAGARRSMRILFGLALVCLLACVALGLQASSVRKDRRVSRHFRASAATLERACAAYEGDLGEPPRGLSDFWSARPETVGRWKGPYLLPRDLKDPFGRYLSERGTHELQVVSFGADGRWGQDDWIWIPGARRFRPAKASER